MSKVYSQPRNKCIHTSVHKVASFTTSKDNQKQKCLGCSCLPLSQVSSVKSKELKKEFTFCSTEFGVILMSSHVHFTERLIKFTEQKRFSMFFLTLLPPWDTIKV